MTVGAYRIATKHTWVVLRPHDTAAQEELSGLDVEIIRNPDHDEGQSASLRLGLRSLPTDTEAAVIGVADQPLLRPSTIHALISAWVAGPAQAVVPLYRGDRGNPVLFSRALFAELSLVRGDIGGRGVLARHSVRSVEIPEWWTGMDVNTQENLAVAHRYLREPPTEA